jgi:hypothetical protein
MLKCGQTRGERLCVKGDDWSIAGSLGFRLAADGHGDGNDDGTTTLVIHVGL